MRGSCLRLTIIIIAIINIIARSNRRWGNSMEIQVKAKLYCRAIYILKQSLNALGLSSAQALNMLSSTSWKHLNTHLRGVEWCWVLLSQIWNWSNLSLNSTPHFLCFAVIHVWLHKVECICTATFNMLSPHTCSAQRIHWEFKYIEDSTRWHCRS